ncbi:MAG TPA: thioredoxin family protein [Usitatibacteraceae bacterium]|jgi:peroxiredoxin|nr:thioredoxin family protein [Verrucomicrobiales bacterium]HRE13292.1 thioredoxin family protein [Usitatibacteraceae bacterium]
MIRQALALAAATAFAGTAFANAVVGQPAPGFTLTDLAGKPVNLADYKGKTVVLEWHNFNCPFVQKHYKSGNMQALQKKYGGDVVWLAVNSTNNGHQDWMEPAKIGKTLSDFGAAPAKYLVDEPGKVGLSYGAKTTPHMYIIDGTGKVLYNGAIDDKRSANVDDVKGAKNYVAAALDEIKAGKPVSTPSTTPYGCTIKYR